MLLKRTGETCKISKRRIDISSYEVNLNILQNALFMHDGEPAHFYSNVRRILNEKFNSR